MYGGWYGDMLPGNTKNLLFGQAMTDFGTPVLTQLLPEEEMRHVSSVSVRRCYRNGELVHDRGDGPATMGIVVRGAVMLVRPRANGRDIFLCSVKVGQNFGDITLPFAEICSHRAIAVGETQIDHISCESFQRLMGRPAIAQAFYTVAAYRLGLSVRMLDDMRSLPVDVIFAKLLLDFHDSMGQSRTLEFVQDDFASYIGVSLVTLNKTLRRLKQAALIETGYRQICIVDPDGLRRWVKARSTD
jgi:CRP-like cAMP-binding protein